MRVAIIGGGPGGLMTGYLLERRAPGRCAITLYEAGDRLGGKVLTRQFRSAPVAYEAGAAELYDYSHLGPDPLRELIAEFGLTTRPMSGETVILGDRVISACSRTCDQRILRNCPNGCMLRQMTAAEVGRRDSSFRSRSVSECNTLRTGLAPLAVNSTHSCSRQFASLQPERCRAAAAGMPASAGRCQCRELSPLAVVAPLAGLAGAVQKP